GPVGSISGPSTVCPGATASYSVPNVSNAGFYTWTVPPGATVDGQPSGTTFDAPGGHLVEVTFGATGGPVCVKVANSCAEGGMVCKNVQVVPLPPTTLPKVTVCNEDLPYVLPWGAAVNVSGTFTNTYTSYLGCDSVVNQQVAVKPPIITDLAPKVICQGTCVQVCGENFCTSGPVAKTCPSFQGCDSLIRFQLTVLHPVAEILGGNVLDCAMVSTLLHAAASAPNAVKSWKKLDGTVLANNVDSIVIYGPGAYILTVTQQMAGVSCSQADTVVITGNFTVPPIMATVGDSLTCLRPKVQLIGSSTPGALYAWTGPGIFSSMEMSPLAYTPGLYTLVVTDPTSHCTASATTQVLAENNLPAVQIFGAAISCIQSSVPLKALTSANSPVTYTWSGPNGFTSMAAMLEVAVAGTYTVTITDGLTGCLAAANYQVQYDTVIPTVLVTGGTLNCAQSAVTLSVSTSAITPSFHWTGPGGFTSNLSNPTVVQAGLYQLTITNMLSGCTATASTMVLENFLMPGAAAMGGILHCNGTPISLSGSSITSGVTFSWTGPGFPNPTPAPMVTLPGTYTLLVTAQNGCTSTATAEVVAAQIPDITDV
ncbi:MAG: hypothetical protein ABIO24_00520, partial [Saprospiraceae bacterium]